MKWEEEGGHESEERWEGDINLNKVWGNKVEG